MNKIKISEVKLVTEKSYISFTCFNELLYFVDGVSDKIDVYKNHLFLKSIVTDVYSNILYVPELDNFIVTKCGELNRLLFLNKDFQKEKELLIDADGNYLDVVTSISYCGELRQFIISNYTCTFSITLEGEFIKVLKKYKESSLYPSYCDEIKHKPLCLRTENNNWITKSVNDSNYLCMLSKNNNEVIHHYIDDFIRIEDFKDVNGCIVLLVNKHDCGIHLIYVIEREKDYSLEIDPKGCLISSIAAVQKSIACILNQEGHKIETVLNECDDVDKYLKVNQSVERTIKQLTRFEQELVDKLEILVNQDD